MERQDLERLIQDPSERMDTELKQWMDPTLPETIGKIAKACIALRNNDGGRLIFGFLDGGAPDPAVPSDVRTAFDLDKIQEIISKYASEPFSVAVEFVAREGVEYPVIEVPRGVETPVAAKSDLPHSDRKKPPHVRCNAVYVRTLHSNGRISSSDALWKDWPQIVRKCFDNREADIGAFIRRHLSNVDLGPLSGLLATPAPSLTIAQQAIGFLDTGKSRFVEVSKKNQHTPPQSGTFEVAIVIGGEFPPVSANADFYRKLQLNKPKHTGWSLWIGDYSPPPDIAYVFQDGWESLTGAPAHLGGFDFWRAETKGRFYHIRKLWDDCHAPEIVPQTRFDYALHTSHVTEAVSIGSYFARTLGCNELSTTLGFACRWTGLDGRVLYSWSDPDRGFVSPPAAQDEKTTSATMPLETPESAYAPVVESLVAPLFELFGGMKFESRVIAGIVRKTLENRY